MGRQALVEITGPVCAALEADQFIFGVNTRFNAKCLAIMEAGADDDIEYLRAFNRNRFRCGSCRIRSGCIKGQNGL